MKFADAKSHSLVFFGVQSGIEVLSALLVLWRFKNIAQPGEERGMILSPANLKYKIYLITMFSKYSLDSVQV
jgi:hypothetical protein